MLEKVVYPELSYKIVGALFKVHRELGPRLQEKYYQRAVAIEFTEQGIAFEREVKVDLLFRGEKIGHYFFDFLVEGLIILELKTVDLIRLQDVKQVLAYQETKNIRLGIIANFRIQKLEYKRVIKAG